MWMVEEMEWRVVVLDLERCGPLENELRWTTLQ